MTDQQLTGFAYQVANMIKNDMRNTGSCRGVIGCVYSGRLLRMRKVEAFIIKTCGEGWLNDDRAKSAASAFLRGVVDAKPPEAFAFGSIVNRFKSSEKLNALPHEEANRILKSGKGNAQLVAEGWGLPPEDAVFAIVQTPDRVCLFNQTYDSRERTFTGEPDVQCAPHSTFSGRLKIFGEGSSVCQ